jgi:hypothetical protein
LTLRYRPLMIIELIRCQSYETTFYRTRA